MRTDLVTVHRGHRPGGGGRLFAEHGLLAIPVVDADGRMKGIVTVDDIVDVVQEEATEDIQKIGGMEALDAPYLQIGFATWCGSAAAGWRRCSWARCSPPRRWAYFEDEIARAVVLALFVPLIISSGGNSGSQATTLVIRAMALGEVRLRDWWRVVRREIAAGLALGLILGASAWCASWSGRRCATRTASTTCWSRSPWRGSLVGVVLFGTLAGLDAAVPPAAPRRSIPPAPRRRSSRRWST